MSLKFLDLSGLTYFKSKLNFVDETQLQSAINTALANYKQSIVTIVTALPDTGEEGRLYLVPGSGSNVYNTYTWETIDGTAQWVSMGSTTVTITVDSALDANSTNPVQNGVIKAAIDAVTPTASIAENGTNSVTSGAIYSALASKLNTSDMVAITTTEIDNIF